MGAPDPAVMRASILLFNVAAIALYASALPAQGDIEQVVPEELVESDTAPPCKLPQNQLGYWVFDKLIPDDSDKPDSGWKDANGLLQYTDDCRMQLQINFPHKPEANLKYSGYATPPAAGETSDPRCFYHQVVRTRNSFPVGSALARCAVITDSDHSLTLIEWYANNSHTHGFSHADAASHWIKPRVDQLCEGFAQQSYDPDAANGGNPTTVEPRL